MKNFSLSLCLGLLSVLTLQAQGTDNNETSSSNKLWWGYVNADAQKYGLGAGSATTYSCAVFIPGNHAVAGGKTINAIRFGLTAPNAKNAKVWIAKTRPASIKVTTTQRLVNVDDASLGSENIEVALDEPYQIPETGTYVGYTFTISQVATEGDAYPILISGEAVPNALFLKMGTGSWGDYYSDGYGNLFLQVQLEGTFADNIATPLDFGTFYLKHGASTTASVQVHNDGPTAISSIDYTITADGVTGSEQHVDLTTPIAFCQTGAISVPVTADDAQGVVKKTLAITKVNGLSNNATDQTADFTVYTFTDIHNRNVVVEQFTGTGCGWCPRGHVGMEKMRNTFGDRFIGIAIHQYSAQSSDAMFIARTGYAAHGLTGAPSCRMNRRGELDPYYGSATDVCNDFRAEMDIPALADIEVSGKWNEEKTEVEATAKVEALIPGDYTLEFVLVADGLKGTGTGWNQANYYSSSYASQTGITKSTLPSDLQYLYDLGSTFNPTFNDVAIASSYKSSQNQVAALTLASGEPQEVSFTLTMPTYAKLVSALQYDQISVVALLVDAQGHIANAAKQTVGSSETPSGMSAVQTAGNRQEVSRYTIDGRQVTTPQRGINIVKMSDGTTRKVVIK